MAIYILSGNLINGIDAFSDDNTCQTIPLATLLKVDYTTYINHILEARFKG